MSSATEKKDLEEDEDEDEDFVLASKDVQELESLIYKEADQAVREKQLQMDQKRLEDTNLEIRRLEKRAEKMVKGSHGLLQTLERIDELQEEREITLKRISKQDKETNSDDLYDANYDNVKDDKDEDDEDDEKHETIGPDMLLTDSLHDDSDLSSYERRLMEWKSQRLVSCSLPDDTFADGEIFHAKSDGDSNFSDEFLVPEVIWKHLFKYQRVGVRWLWALHGQQVGGILGDEMGLGKTVQIIAFLAGLWFSKKWTHPTIIVCPATVMKQWLKELRRWWTPFRVWIYHQSGSASKYRSLKSYLKDFFRHGDILITTYATLLRHESIFRQVKWQYVILDEGHKIRNPDANITIACKTLDTPHRLILSGTPIQNNLKELWSLFDFVYPGRLGTLPIFEEQFSIPISLGGFSHSSTFQVETAYQCARKLRDLINPYLLRRLKSEVTTDLPAKEEKVLFCRITPLQRQLYEDFVHSRQIQEIYDGKRMAFYGIDYLRKVCNHVDLIVQKPLHTNYDDDDDDNDNDGNDDDVGRIYGGTKPSPIDPGSFVSDFSQFSMEEKSGKVRVLFALLRRWKKSGNKVLLFCQTRQMMTILEEAIKFKEYRYLRMDGNTPIPSRSKLVDEFNANPEIFLFLLTTKVGGLGINLTGADRVIIFDPDWNPSTDAQARERAWRLGQKKDVVIYRLITTGTIEEKIYHRQIFKQFLTNKILKDPKQSRFFNSTDLYDLFVLEDERTDGNHETTDLLSHIGDEISMMMSQGGRKRKRNNNRKGDEFEEERDLAKAVSRITSHESKKGEPPSKSEDNILQSLMDATGIQSVMRHDLLVEQKRPDYVLIEQEAGRIANNALKALKESSSLRKEQGGVRIPTWTGKSGRAGIPLLENSVVFKKPNATISPNPKPYLNMGQMTSDTLSTPVTSSKSLLNVIRQRQSNSDLPIKVVKDKYAVILSDLRDLFLRYGGRAASSTVISAFKDRISESETTIFRKLLKQIAKFDSANKVWVLLSSE